MTINGGVFYRGYAKLMETLDREKIELAEFMEDETQLDFDQAMGIVDMLCDEVLPGYLGTEKLIMFRLEIRDRIKSGLEPSAMEEN